MTRRPSSPLRVLWTAVRITVVLTVMLGVIYPLAITAIGQLALPAQTNGSVLHSKDGTVVGSALIGQSFTDAEGQPLRQYFQPRPSAADYDTLASGGTNLGPENPDLVAAITARRAQVAELEGVSPEKVPVDALTASGSGLDPHISPAYAQLQVARVAAARGLTVDEVQRVVAAHTSGRDLGYLGEPRVNVVELNLALDSLGE